MFNFGETINWNNTPVLKVEGAAVTEGECVSAEGKKFNFTDDLMLKIISHIKDPIPIGILHGNDEVYGYAPKVGYDPVNKCIPFQGFVFNNDKRKIIESHGFNKISPEMEFIFDNVTGEPIDGHITKLAFVRTPAMSGTQVTCADATFAAPSHPWSYGKDETGKWVKPSLESFTDQSWGDLSDKEIRNIAGHYAYAAELPPKKFGDLKFPHHDPKTHDVVWNGVANAMARLNQSSISDDDKKQVYKHLVKHYKEFNKVAPAMFERCNNMTENKNGVMVFYPNGVFTPTDTTTTSGTNFSAPNTIVVGTANFEAEIASLKTKVSNFEAENATLKTQVETANASKTETDNKYAALETDYKKLQEQYGVLMSEKTDVYVSELKKLGFKAPEEIGKELPIDQRIAVLKQMKDNFVINAPANNPTESINVQPKNIVDKAALLQKMGISPENAKLIKVN